jgi:AraC-like DNA-binding protein
MAMVWRAADVAPTAREEAFMEIACGSIVPYARQAPMILEDLDQVRSADIGMLRVMRFNWTEGAAVRAARHVRRSDPGLCKIDITLSGRFALEQSDRQAALHAGSFTFVDLSRPHRLAANRTDLAVVMFPRARLPLRDKDIVELAGATFDRTQPGSALVTSVVRELTANLSAYEGQDGARIGESVLDLICATLAARVDRMQAVPSDTRRRALVQQIRAYIEANLDDPDLAPPVIAAQHHISPRQLHKLFEPEATTVAGLIRARRLARCRHDLLDPSQATRPVASIAARWGMYDAAYFNRVFHAEYGMPPGEYRRLAADRAELPLDATM